MEIFNLITDFFNSLDPIIRVLIFVGTGVIAVLIAVVCIVASLRRKRRKKQEQIQNHERKKRALADFMSTQKEGEKELSSLFNGKESSEVEVTGEPVLKDESSAYSPMTDARAKEANKSGEEQDVIEKERMPFMEFCEDIERAKIPDLDYEPVDETDVAGETDTDLLDTHLVHDDENVFAFVLNKEKKPPAGFALKLTEAENEVKANYCNLVNYALAYKKLKMKKSANSEKAYFGSNLLFMIKINGKSLRIYFALRFADYEKTTVPVSDESDKKSYEKTPVMLKITSPLSVKRAKMLIDDVAKRFGCEKGKEVTVLTAEAI